jgi:hypothetical protein
MKKGEWQKKWKWEGGRMAKEVEWGGGQRFLFCNTGLL